MLDGTTHPGGGLAGSVILVFLAAFAAANVRQVDDRSRWWRAAGLVLLVLPFVLRRIAEPRGVQPVAWIETTAAVLVAQVPVYLGLLGVACLAGWSTRDPKRGAARRHPLLALATFYAMSAGWADLATWGLMQAVPERVLHVFRHQWSLSLPGGGMWVSFHFAGAFAVSLAGAPSLMLLARSRWPALYREAGRTAWVEPVVLGATSSFVSLIVFAPAASYGLLMLCLAPAVMPFALAARRLRGWPGSAPVTGMRVTAVSGGERPECPVCGEAIDASRADCALCGTPHHEECFRYNGRCGVYACNGTP